MSVYAIGTAGRLVCLRCNGLYAPEDMAVDFGRDRTGRPYHTGLCQDCMVPAPDAMTDEDALVEELRR